MVESSLRLLVLKTLAHDEVGHFIDPSVTGTSKIFTSLLSERELSNPFWMPA